MKKTQTVKMWKSTLDNLRLLYAKTGRPMIEILDDLVKQKLKELEHGSKDRPN